MTSRLQITASTHLPTAHGTFLMESFRHSAGASPGAADAGPHLALSVGLESMPASATPLVRIHSECLTSEVFGSLKCDCAEQLDSALAAIQEAGRGVVLYLRQEGRGIGLENKLKAYALQEHGLDTVEANLALGLPIDARRYDAALQYLQRRGIGRCALLTNNPDKLAAVRAGGIEVVRRPLRVPGHAHPGRACYLESKRTRLGQDC